MESARSLVLEAADLVAFGASTELDTLSAFVDDDGGTIGQRPHEPSSGR